MKRVVLDTNALVSFVTDRHPEQQAKTAALFAAAADRKIELILHQMVISEIVYVLGNLYRIKPAEVAGTIGDLLASPGVRPVDEVPWSKVLDLWPREITDFADAVLAAITLEEHFDAIATFERPFIRHLRHQGLVAFFT